VGGDSGGIDTMNLTADKGCLCINCQRTRMREAAPQLAEALVDLLEVISRDQLIPESVSYMQQARAALTKAGI
jgi:hypothetical protein